jgi:putative inorganic carbon (hco3(-)) transporter
VTTQVRKPGTEYLLLLGNTLLIAIVMGAAIAYAPRFLGDNGPYIVGGAVLVAVVGIAILFKWQLGVLMLVALLPYQETINTGSFTSGFKALTLLTFFSLALGLLREQKLLERFRRLWRQPLTLAVFLFVLWALASVLWASNEGAALARTGTFGGVFGLMVLIGMLEERYLVLLWAILALSAALSVPAAFVLPSSEEILNKGRFSSGLHPNDYAGLLVIVFFAAYFGLRRYRMATYILAPVLLFGIFASLSRTGLIALAATPVLAIMFVPRLAARLGGRTLLVYGLVAAALVVIFLVIPPVGESVWERYMTLYQYQNEDTWAGRWAIWWAALGIFASHPFLGVGAGNYPYFALGYSVEYVTRLSGKEGEIAGVTHQIFLAVASELGLVGLMLFLAILFLGFKLALQLSRRSFLGTGMLVSLVAYTVIGMTTAWEYQKIGYIVLGSILSLGLQQKNTTEAESEGKAS